MRLLTNEDVSRLLTVEECIPVVERVFKEIENTQMPPKIYLDIPNGDFRAMPAVVGNTAGIKWCGVHMDESGKKRKINIFAKVLINDVESGKLLLIMDAEVLTATRTAAVTGVATRYMSPEDARVAAFVGCGMQTPRQIQAVCAVRDIKRVNLFDLDRERMLGMCKTMEYLHAMAIEVHPCLDLESCVGNADIVTTLTPSREGFLDHHMLKDVCHINAVGADAAGKRELRANVLRGVGVIAYDEWEQCSHSGEIQYLDELSEHGALLSLAHIVKDGFYREDQTLFDATGLAIEDVATARYIYDKITNDTCG
jgi:alanine dehydrogenase